MNGWSPNDLVIAPGIAITGVVTDQVISRTFPISASGARNIVIKAKWSAVTQVGTLTLKLQTAIGDDWVDSKTATFTAAGNTYIKINIEVAGDQTFLPLLAKGRLVLTTTNAGDSVTPSEINVLQEL